MKMNIPTREDINVYDSLDERTACDHFLDKNLEEAEDLFRQNSQYYQEDLMWMGPRAFRYYINAAINYLQSESASGDSDVLLWFGGILGFWLKFYKHELVPVARQLAPACRFLLEHWNRFDTDSLRSDLKEEYVHLEQALGNLAS